jgi:hypothetical protein
MTWPGRQLAIAHGAQFSAQRLLGDGDAELFVYPLRQVDQPPAHHAVNRRDRAALDHLGDRLALAIIEPGGLAWRLSVQQTVGPRALNRNTQSRMICRPTPPILAASVRVAPS